MNDFTLGIVVFVAATSVVALFMVGALNRARQEGVTGQALLGRLVPYLVADLALTIVFVVWLLGRV
jgi:hypothetical protein